MKKATIALEDGTLFQGRAFVGDGEIFGELVFNTSMTGYQEILTDPSYHGQIVTLTYPLIGNYGMNPADNESYQPHCAGLVIGECSHRVSNWRSTQTLPEFLDQHGLMGIDQVDTRAITLHIRRQGAMKCVISTEDQDPGSLARKAAESEGLVGRDLATPVSTKERFTWKDPNPPAPYRQAGSAEKAFRVATLDCGMKYNQLRILDRLGCEVEVFPVGTAAEEILEGSYDGLFVSNGPGDPEAVAHVVENLRKVVTTGLPTFGICFGHQLLGQALGGSTYKLKFGHRGGNQPVLNLATGKVEITSQNHGFCVDKDSLGDAVDTTHINLNDQTSEGLRHRELPLFSVQYHPEAAPGPNDSVYLFDEFIQLMKDNNS